MHCCESYNEITPGKIKDRTHATTYCFGKRITM